VRLNLEKLANVRLHAPRLEGREKRKSFFGCGAALINLTRRAIGFSE
jgi:hypothetical protein